MNVFQKLFGSSSPTPPSAEPLKQAKSKANEKGPKLPKPNSPDQGPSSIPNKSMVHLKKPKGGGVREPLKLREELMKFIDDQKDRLFTPNQVRTFHDVNCGSKSILFLNALSKGQDLQPAKPRADMTDEQKTIEKQTENILKAIEDIPGDVSIPLHSKMFFERQNFADATIGVFTTPENLALLQKRGGSIILEGDQDALKAWNNAIDKLTPETKAQAKKILHVNPEPMAIQKTQSPLIVCPIRGDHNTLTMKNIEKSGPTAQAILRAFMSAEPAEDGASASSSVTASAASSSAEPSSAAVASAPLASDDSSSAAVASSVASVATEVFPPVSNFAGGAGLNPPPTSAAVSNPPPIEFDKEKQAAIETVKADGMVVKTLAMPFKNDPDVVLAAVKQNGLAILDAGNKIKRNEEQIKPILIAAISNRSMKASEAINVINKINIDFTKDKEVMLAAIKNNPEMANYLTSPLKEDPEIIAAVAKAASQSSSAAAGGPAGNLENVELTPEETRILTPEQGEALKEARVKIANAKILSPGMGWPPETSAYSKNTPLAVQQQQHAMAKNFLSEVIPALGGKISFISHGKDPSNDESLRVNLADVKINPSKLNHNIISFEWTSGVQKDIQECGEKNDGILRIFIAASQFNLAEARSIFTPSPDSWLKYFFDQTQGPQAQLAYGSDQIRAILAAANHPYNALSPILSEETKGTVTDGYFMPTKETEDQLIEELRNKGHQIELALFGSTPRTQLAELRQNEATNAIEQKFDDYPRGKQIVYLGLCAAPAIENAATAAGIRKEDFSQEIPFLTALHRCRSECKAAIDLAKAEGKPVELKTAAVGCGAFGNPEEVVAKALYQALMEYQEELEANNVTVQLQVFGKKEDTEPTIVKNLGLAERVNASPAAGEAAAASAAQQ